MAEARPLLIIKAGGTFPRLAKSQGDFDDWVAAGLDLPTQAIRVLDPRRASALPEPAALAGVVMTGSHAMVTDWTPWMARLADWLARVVEAEVPYLGICFGHQLLAQALGGRVDYHPGGREIGTVNVRLEAGAEADRLFSTLPAAFPAHVVHAQTVLTLPRQALRLAGNDFEPTHAFRAGEAAWGVQFHPEFDAARMAAYVDELGADLAGVGRDPAAIKSAIAETPLAASLLPKFSGLCWNRF